MISKLQRYAYVPDTRNMVIKYDTIGLCLMQNDKTIAELGGFQCTTSKTSAADRKYLLLQYSMSIIAYSQGVWVWNTYLDP